MPVLSLILYYTQEIPCIFQYITCVIQILCILHLKYKTRIRTIYAYDIVKY